MTLSPSLMNLVLGGALAAGAAYLLMRGTKGITPAMQKKLEKLITLAEEVHGEADVARTSMRLAALNAEIGVALLEELRKTHDAERRDRNAAASLASTNAASARAEVIGLADKLAAKHDDLGRALLAAIQKLTETVQPRMRPRRKASSTKVRRPAGTKRKRAKP
jgi:hypothetical protein